MSEIMDFRGIKVEQKLDDDHNGDDVKQKQTTDNQDRGGEQSISITESIVKSKFEEEKQEPSSSKLDKFEEEKE